MLGIMQNCPFTPPPSERAINDMKNNYRVVDDNSVLNYYSTRDQAKAYLLDLKKHSPAVYKQARIQKLGWCDNWHTLTLYV